MQTAASEDLMFEKAFCVTSFMKDRLCRRNSGSGTSSSSTSSSAPSPNSREPAGPPDRACASTILPAKDDGIAVKQSIDTSLHFTSSRHTQQSSASKYLVRTHLSQTVQHGRCR